MTFKLQLECERHLKVNLDSTYQCKPVAMFVLLQIHRSSIKQPSICMITVEVLLAAQLWVVVNKS